MKISRLLTEFIESEKASGVILIACSVISLVISNLDFGAQYQEFWHFQLGAYSLEHWINDGLMTIFFLLIGLELEREVYIGELSKFKEAVFPMIAALGGMLVPAGIYFAFNHGTLLQAGTGIPMATDIAFALAVLSLLGKRVPLSLKVFLTALAVIDDLGAILVIALFYTKALSLLHLGAALLIMAVLFILNRSKVNHWLPYLAGGIGMWYFMLHSGIHATISGVLLAFVIPFGDGGEKTISYRLQQLLHKPVAFVILPLFALANTAIPLASDWAQGLKHTNSIGIFLGLVCGKPLGITIFCFAAVFLGLCQLPKGLKWQHIIATGCLAGIGFTMSIFITLLAFDPQSEAIPVSKIAIIISSLVAGMLGFLLLRKVLSAAASEE